MWPSAVSPTLIFFNPAAMRPIPVSVQLWSVRDHLAKDFAGTVTQLASFGFHGVETAGYGNLDAVAAAAALKAVGLKCSGMHVGIDTVRGNLIQLVAEARYFECQHLICPWMPKEIFVNAAAASAIGEELEEIGLRLRAHGLQFHYHNHDGEIAVHDGQTIFEHLLAAAAPASLGAEVDVYWVKIAGQDPAQLLRRLGARCRLIHLKDQAEIGTGPVDFPAVFSVIDSIGAIECQVIEVEEYNHDPLESVRRSLVQLKKWGRA